MKEQEVKQVIVMRKDLGMRKGKMISQGAHASMGALLQYFRKQKCYEVKGGLYEEGQASYKYSHEFMEGSAMDKWLNGIFTKICVGVDSEEELLEIKKRVEDEISNCACALIEDAGLTEFNGVVTKTCLGIGPYPANELDKITGHLKLL